MASSTCWCRIRLIRRATPRRWRLPRSLRVGVRSLQRRLSGLALWLENREQNSGSESLTVLVSSVLYFPSPLLLVPAALLLVAHRQPRLSTLARFAPAALFFVRFQNQRRYQLRLSRDGIQRYKGHIGGRGMLPLSG